MKGLGSTLATIWRLAIPYFRSEDRRAGSVLLLAIVLIELSIVAINVMINQWNSRFYNALQDKNWDAFVSELLFFCLLAGIFIVLAVYQLYLNQWLQIRWRRWMTQHYLDDWLEQCQPLPHAASGRRCRQPRPAHRRGHQSVHREGPVPQPRPAQLGGHARFVRRHSLAAVGERAVHPVRHPVGDSGLSGLGGADLFHRRHCPDAVDRPRAGRGSTSCSSATKRTSATISSACGRTPNRSRCSKGSPRKSSACWSGSVSWWATGC